MYLLIISIFYLAFKCFKLLDVFYVTFCLPCAHRKLFENMTVPICVNAETKVVSSALWLPISDYYFIIFIIVVNTQYLQCVEQTQSLKNNIYFKKPSNLKEQNIWHTILPSELKDFFGSTVAWSPTLRLVCGKNVERMRTGAILLKYKYILHTKYIDFKRCSRCILDVQNIIFILFIDTCYVFPLMILWSLNLCMRYMLYFSLG